MAVRTKAPIAVFVPHGGQIPDSAPPDLRQLHDRLARPGSGLRSGQPLNSSGRQCAWLLATLPLLQADKAVGALVVAGPLGDAACTLQEGPAAFSHQRVLGDLVHAAAALTEEMFGSSSARKAAYQVCALAAAVAAASDSTTAVRDAAVQLEALVAQAGPGLPRLRVTLGLATSKPGAAAATGAIAGSSNTGGSTCSATSPNATAASASGSTASCGSCNVPTAGVAAVTASSNQPQVHLYCTPHGQPPVILPAQETLLCVPLRGDHAASALQGSVSRVADSDLVAQLQQQQPYQHRPQRIIALRCPEKDGAPPQPQMQVQIQEAQRLQQPQQLQQPSVSADVAALDASGARATRGSVCVVSCPVPGTFLAIMVYACVAPPEAAGPGPPGVSCGALNAHASGAPAPGRCGGEGGAGASAAVSSEATAEERAQLSEAQLKLVTSTVSSVIEVLASCLELRFPLRRGSQPAAPLRHAGRGSLELEPNPQERSGLLTLSEACADDDEPGFWGSASALDLSTESALTSQVGALSLGISAPTSAAHCLRLLRPTTSNSGSAPTAVRLRPSNLSAMHCADINAVTRGSEERIAKSMTTAQSHLLLSNCLASDAPDGAGPISGATQRGGAGGSGPQESGDVSGGASADAAAAAPGGGGSGSTMAMAVAAAACCDLEPVGPSTDGFTAVCAALEQAGSESLGFSTAGGDMALAAPYPGSGVSAGPLGVGGGDFDSGCVAAGAATVRCDHSDVCNSVGSASQSPLPGRAAAAAATGSGSGDALQHLAWRSSEPFDAHTGNLRASVGAGGVAPAAPQSASQLLAPMPRDLMNRTSWPDSASTQPAALDAPGRLKTCSAGGSGRLLAGYVRPPPLPLNADAPWSRADRNGGNDTALRSGESRGSGPGSQLRDCRDCSDQASEADGSEHRPVSLRGDSGSCASSSSSQPRMKVLSLGKAALQLQRVLPNPVAAPAPAPGGAAAAQSPTPASTHTPLHPQTPRSAHQQQQELQEQPRLLCSPQHWQQPTTVEAAPPPSLGLQAAAAVAEPLSSAGVDAATATAACVHTPYQPRRLARMYLPASRAAADGHGPGVATPAASCPTPAATPVAGPWGVSNDVSVGVAPASLTPCSGSLTPPQPVNPLARVLASGGHAHAAHAGASTAGAASDSSTSPLPRSAGAAVSISPAHTGTQLQSGAPSARPLSQLLAAAAAFHAGPPGTAAAAGHLARLSRSGISLPDATVGAAASCTAATVPTVISASAGSPRRASRKPPARQLSDYVIPEHEPLESTVSETVAMMRMLSQARGAHLSSRLRRVRVTAKIRSSHPEALPPDLPSRLAAAALAGGEGGGGLFRPAMGVAAPGGTWVLTGVAARRGCVELVFDLVQLEDGHGGHGEEQLPAVGCVPSKQTQPQQQSQQQLSQRRRQVREGGRPAPGKERPSGCGSSGTGDAAPNTDWAEQQWLQDACGLRPEAIGGVLQRCGLLSPATDPWVEVQVGHDPGGAVTLAWDAVRELWAAATAPEVHGDEGLAAQTAEGVVEPGSEVAMEAPTLWLPNPVAVLTHGSSKLRGVRLVSWSQQLREGETEDLTVRTAYCFLPCHRLPAAAPEPEATGGVAVRPGVCSRTGAADRSGTETYADGECRWSVLEVEALGSTLCCSGGLLVVECRRTAHVPGEPSGKDGSAPLAVASRVTTSAPAPLVVLPPQQADVGAELQHLDRRIAMLLLGSEDAVGGPAAAPAAEAAAHVEMARQQFLLDLGMLLDAAAAAAAATDAAAPSASASGASGDAPAPAAWASTSATSDDPARISFEDDLRALLLHGAGGASPGVAPAHGEAGSNFIGGSGNASVDAYRQHLLDVACTLLAGCVAMGLHRTAALVVRLACAPALALTAPELLLGEAVADPRVAADLLSTLQVVAPTAPVGTSNASADPVEQEAVSAVEAAESTTAAAVADPASAPASLGPAAVAKPNPVPEPEQEAEPAADISGGSIGSSLRSSGVGSSTGASCPRSPLTDGASAALQPSPPLPPRVDPGAARDTQPGDGPSGTGGGATPGDLPLLPGAGAAPADDSEPQGGGSNAVEQPGPPMTGREVALADAAAADPWWALSFSDASLEAEYWRFVVERTRSMLWTYFLIVSFVSVVSCIRAWVEDGLSGFFSFLLFSGAQGVVMGWYCLGGRRGRGWHRDPRDLWVAGMACKALRGVGVLLMGTGVMVVPSLMEPMTVRGVDVFAESFMRPIAERVPYRLSCLALALEMPCVWLLFSYFCRNYPNCFMRQTPLLRALLFDALSLLVGFVAELYWRRAFRLWRRRRTHGGGVPGTELQHVGGGNALDELGAHKARAKED